MSAEHCSTAHGNKQCTHIWTAESNTHMYSFELSKSRDEDINITQSTSLVPYLNVYM